MTGCNSMSPICLSSDVDDGAVEDKIRVRLDFLATQKTGANPKPVQIRLQTLASRLPEAFMVAIREKRFYLRALPKITTLLFQNWYKFTLRVTPVELRTSANATLSLWSHWVNTQLMEQSIFIVVYCSRGIYS